MNDIRKFFTSDFQLRRRVALATLSLLMGFASISTDIYLPAMPAIAVDFEASPGVLEWSVSGYLLGAALGQLFWGPFSDRFGRKPPIFTGVVIFTIGSAGCAMAGNPATFIIWRLVQAFGACAGVVLSRVMVRDLYDDARAARVLSSLLIATSIAPLIGPVVGSEILAIAGWRMIFWALVGVGAVTLGFVLVLPETLGAAATPQFRLHSTFHRYLDLSRNRRFMNFCGASGCLSAALFAYVAGSPFAFISYHHVPEGNYGLLFASGVIGVMAGNVLNTRLVTRYGATRMLHAGALVAAAAGLAAAFASSTDFGGIAGLFIPLLLVLFASGMIVANAFVGATSQFPHMAGSASALIGAIQFGCGMIGSLLVGAFADGTVRPLGWVVCIASVGALRCARQALSGRGEP